MPLGSDVTAFYGAVAAGRSPSLTYDSPYNTLIHGGLPVGPISTVSDSSLAAVAGPATTSWLYFVAGDDGTAPLYFRLWLSTRPQPTPTSSYKLCAAPRLPVALILVYYGGRMWFWPHFTGTERHGGACRTRPIMSSIQQTIQRVAAPLEPIQAKLKPVNFF